MKLKTAIIRVSLHRNTKAKVMYPFNPFGKRAMDKYEMNMRMSRKYSIKHYFHVNLQSMYAMEC